MAESAVTDPAHFHPQFSPTRSQTMSTSIVSQSNVTNNRIIAWLTGILTLLLALSSFVLSFNALAALAAAHDVSIPILFPLTVEAGVVIFSLNALYRSLHGENAKVQWGLIIGSSLLAGAFNILHAQEDIVSRVMAAMPSLFLLLSFETFLGQVKHAVKRSSLVQSIEQLTQDLEQERSKFKGKLERMRSTLRQKFEQERSTLKGQIEQLTKDIEQKHLSVQTLTQDLEQKRSTVIELEEQIAELQRSKKAASIVQYDVLNAVNADKLNDKQQALKVLLNFYRSNPSATLTEAGEAIERSKGTVSNYLNELEQAGLIHRNGEGVKVSS